MPKIYEFNNNLIMINRRELAKEGRNFLTREELTILELLLHKLKCNQERENQNERYQEESN